MNQHMLGLNQQSLSLLQSQFEKNIFSLREKDKTLCTTI